MIKSWARKSMAVAAIATGAVLFTGGLAQAAPVLEGGVDQTGVNVCGNALADDSIIINFNDCTTVNDVDVDNHYWG
ncbi:hypothetical protein [Stackebrandtia soli]|uniref:hypothetical protein n=1 Tax=Stackebrandtia soli TaxID=1892856 RepID=UPI0039E75858